VTAERSEATAAGKPVFGFAKNVPFPTGVYPPEAKANLPAFLKARNM